jgi:predicted aspartyl protease
MSHIRYSHSEFPPFPAVAIELECLLGATDPMRAKIDTGATRTIVPTNVLDAVGAIRTGRTVSCRSYDGTDRRWPLYEVALCIVDDRWPDSVEKWFDDVVVLGVEGQAEVLLGRDILAAWNLHLDGPNARYSVS